MPTSSTITFSRELGQPLWCAPMGCVPVTVLPGEPGWVCEIDWDGCRAIGSRQGQDCHLSAGNGKVLDREFPALVQALMQLRCRSAVVDGEIVAWDEFGRPSAPLLQNTSHRRDASLVLFDLLMLNGRDLRNKPLLFRRSALRSVLPRGDLGALHFSESLEGQPAALMNRAARHGWVGIVAKQQDSPYESGGRSGAWVEWKAETTARFFIGGYVPAPQGFLELILGEMRGGQLHYVGRVHGGVPIETQRRVVEAIEPLRQPACPFVDLPDDKRPGTESYFDEIAMRRCFWVKPRGAVNVAFESWTEDRKLRHPRFVSV